MKVLLAYDGSECADQALLDLQKAGLPRDTQVCVLSVLEHWLPPPSALEVVEHLDYDKEYQTLAQRGAARLRELQPSWQVEAKTKAGAPAATIIETAAEWNADLIVLGSRGRSALGRVFFGSVSQKSLWLPPTSSPTRFMPSNCVLPNVIIPNKPRLVFPKLLNLSIL